MAFQNIVFKEYLNLVSYKSQTYTIDPFLMVFINIFFQFQIVTWIRIRNLELQIRIRQKVPDTCGSGSTTLLKTKFLSDSAGCIVPEH
jgi:hypothetical protein